MKALSLFIPLVLLGLSAWGHQNGTEVDDLLFLDVSEVVGATGFEQEVIGAPASVTIVTAAEIKALGLRNLSEALAILAGVSTYDLRNRFAAHARGYPEAGETNNHLLILLDGHRLNDFIYGVAPLGFELPVHLDVVERIELIQGPGSAVYGANAFTGIINIITFRGRDQQGLSASFETGEFDTQRGNLSMGRRDGPVEWLFSATTADSDGPETLYYDTFDTEDSDGLSRNTDNEDYLSMYLKARFRTWTLTSGWTDYHSGLSTVPNLALFNQPDNELTTHKRFVDLRMDHIFENEDTFDLRFYFDDLEEELALGVIPAPGLEPSVNRTKFRGKGYGVEARYRKMLKSGAVLMLGGEYLNMNRQDLRNEIDSIGVLHDGTHENEVLSLYAQAEWHTGPWNFNLGLRHDHFTNFGDTLNPRAAAIYGFGDKSALKFLYGTAFRAPNAFENHFETPVGLAANPNLEPEEIRTAELVLEHAVTPTLQSRVSLFRNDAEQIINLVFEPETQLFINRNRDGLELEGGEIEMRWRPNPRVSWRMNFSYHNLNLDNPTILLKHPPRELANLSFLWRDKKDRYGLGLHLAYKGRAHHTQQPYANFLLNSNLSWNPHDRIRLSLGIRNLLDREHYESTPPNTAARHAQQDGRVWRMILKTSF